MKTKLSTSITKKAKPGISRLVNYLVWGLIAILLLSTVRNIGKVLRIKGVVAEEKRRIAKIEAENHDLERRAAEIQDPEFIEKEIRDKLGLVKSGEAIVVLPDESTLRKLAPTIESESDSLPDPIWRKWVKLFAP